MRVVVVFLTIFWSSLFYSQLIIAQDVYQVLRDDVQGFKQVKRGLPLTFPEDHFPHPDYRIEWWYITANLKDPQGQDWGLQWTLFRQSLSPESDTNGWDSNQIWMAHAAITTPEQHFFEQRFARGGIGQANVNTPGASNAGGFDAWIDDWRWQSSSDTLFPSTLEFNVGEHKVSLELNSKDNWVLNGDAGFSQKSAQGQASYYYSQPNIVVKGTVKTNAKTITLSGNAWLDREWSSQALAQNQEGWDWFSLHLDDGNKLMVYQLRHDTGDEWISGSWISVDGEVTPLGKDDIELNSISERQITTKNNTFVTLPLDWTIKLSTLNLATLNLPTLNRSLTIKPLYDEQWLSTSFPYWEGVVLVSDDKGQNIGKGYMELTGYQTEQ
jgi:predicted secreted hydrolase